MRRVYDIERSKFGDICPLNKRMLRPSCLQLISCFRVFVDKLCGARSSCCSREGMKVFISVDHDHAGFPLDQRV